MFPTAADFEKVQGSKLLGLDLGGMSSELSSEFRRVGSRMSSGSDAYIEPS